MPRASAAVLVATNHFDGQKGYSQIKETQICTAENDRVYIIIEKAASKGTSSLNFLCIFTVLSKILTLNLKMETSISALLNKVACNDMLHRKAEDDFGKYLLLAQEEYTKRFLSKPAEYWLNLLNATVSTPRVKVLAYPCKQCNKQVCFNVCHVNEKNVFFLVSHTTCMERPYTLQIACVFL